MSTTVISYHDDIHITQPSGNLGHNALYEAECAHKPYLLLHKGFGEGNIIQTKDGAVVGSFAQFTNGMPRNITLNEGYALYGGAMVANRRSHVYVRPYTPQVTG